MQLSMRRAAVGIALVSTLALAVAGCGSTTSAAKSGPVALQETGSTLLYPLFNIWVPTYTKSHKGVTITTAGTGSGTGITDAGNGTVQIGASDAYLAPGAPSGLLNIPLAISAQQIMYNVPGFNSTHLQLSGPVLAGIYTGKITNWDDPAIAAINPGKTLPNLKIVPIHRTDGSGDTFLFTQYLSFSNPTTWGSSSGPQYATSITWPPVQGSVSATGNGGMVGALAQNPGGVAYIGISYLNQATQKGLGYAAVQNKAGNFVLPTQANITAAAQGKVSQTPKNEAISLIYSSGAQAYPIINYEYAIVNDQQSSTQVASEVRTFLDWAISSSGGNQQTFLSQVHFLPLPAAVVQLSQNQISEIK
ncbi:MAG: phosphate ABC transporter substrate-binding protein PstS [Thermaerobacter sp.]|nr:phosphate ABC transporter substrate-binding protein PstS [Thermaerobacter sp.]